MLDKHQILWYNTDVVERLGNLFIVNLLEYSPEHDDKRLKRIWGVTLLGNEATYNRPTRVQFFSRPTMIKSKSNEVII